MKRCIFLSLALLLALLSVQPLFAKEKDKAKQETLESVQVPTEQDFARQQKELLVANINNMRNQELRVAVLQQLLNEEIAKLRNIQAVFCDQYQLDIEKFRKGLYRYDEKEGKFVEVKQ
jgi:flagellar biosynthesis protein FliP